MYRPIVSLAALPLAVLLSATTWAQAASAGGGAPGDGPPVSPSGAATVRTPGTPGASDTPGALLTSPSNNPPRVSSSPADKAGSDKNKKRTSADSSAAPPK